MNTNLFWLNKNILWYRINFYFCNISATILWYVVLLNFIQIYFSKEIKSNFFHFSIGKSFYTQKQSPRGVLWKREKETLAQVFSCEFCEIFKNTYFYRTPLVPASVYWKKYKNFSQCLWYIENIQVQQIKIQFI